MATRFEFDAEELRAGLAQLSDRISRRVQREALREGAEVLRERMAQLAPFDPEPDGPHLRDQMVISNARGVDRNEVAIAVGPARMKPAIGSFQEFGTVHHPAHPFARPAFDGLHRKVLDIIRQEIRLALVRRKVTQPSINAFGPVEGPGGGGLV